MDHFGPHPSSTFEGYYTKYRLPSGASIALIISAVPAVVPGAPHSIISSLASRLAQSNAKPLPPAKPYMISFTYVSADSKSFWQREYWPDKLIVGDSTSSPVPGTGSQGFDITWEGGRFRWTPANGPEELDSISWRVEGQDMLFEARTVRPNPAIRKEGDPSRGQVSGRVPWHPRHGTSTPAGVLARAPLPIQWHVHSVDSLCEFTFTGDDPEGIVQESDRSGVAHAHIEKNWAVSFPSAYMWIQARDHDRSTGICLAGGTLVPGVQAYLVGYQGDRLPSSSPPSREESPRRFVSFMPPSSISLPFLSLGLTSSIDWPSRSAEVGIKGWFTRIRIAAHCEPDTFFNIAAPLNTGHAADYTTQSFAAIVEVTVWERTWPLPWSAWRQVERNVFERGSLEFGGGFYKSHSE